MAASMLDGKVALVTGASRGIGAAVACLFAAEGAAVMLADLREPEGHQLAETLPRASFIRLDVADETSWQHAVDATLKQYGRLDVLVNNAGIYRTAPIEETSLDLFMLTVQINQVGPFLGMRTVIPAMKKQGAGSIINVSSTSGLKGNQNSMAYGSTKWAVRGMSKIAAVELGEHGIRVNSVHPGLIDTPMNHEEMGHDRIREVGQTVPLRRPGQAEDIAQLILFLASDASSYVTGAEHVCDGGMTAGTMRSRFTARTN